MRIRLTPLLRLVALGFCFRIASAADLRVNCAQPAGSIRPLHGVNNGPLNEGETVDVSRDWSALKIPVTRLHDSEWPAGDLVDFHAVFPDDNADPADPASYRFRRTDAYIAPIVAAGSGLVYRLGESIEHSRHKFHVHPPRDPDRWAQACLGIIRHYNEGWAEGHRYGIRYWEIWNEPENRPAMWSGTDDEYYRLYVTAARTIHAAFPEVRVGGPAAGATGEFREGAFHPTPFLRGLLSACRTGRAPLHFFSWHIYTNDPTEVIDRARALRQWLDSEGFRDTELHLNEWNFLPGNSWNPMLNSANPAARTAWYRDMGGEQGARFVAATLIALQDSPVTVANYYSGDTSPFGLFERFGTPKSTYFSVLAFQQVREMPRRVPGESTDPRQRVLAGLDAERGELRILCAHDTAVLRGQISIQDLPWKGMTDIDIGLLTSEPQLQVTKLPPRDVTGEPVVLDLPEAGLVRITLRKR